MSPADQLAVFRRGAVQIVPEDELVRKLGNGRPLRIKFGLDPTAPNIHLGHTVPLTKLRHLQDAGHLAVIIIGDFTARIGDPTGRSATRPSLSTEEIEVNLRTYEEQVFKILNRRRVEVRRNSEWLSGLSLEGVIQLAAKTTVARLLERDDFHERYRRTTPIGLHELLYPLMQGYDSVRVEADVELGGTDQTFNLLMGRDLQRAAGQEGQVILAMPLLEGLDGVQKMSKSLGNEVGVMDPPIEMYGKIMSISDTLMGRYYELLSMAGADAMAALRSGRVHPMEAKKALAAELVTRFHGAEAVGPAARFFEERFQKRQAVDPTVIRLDSGVKDIWICQLVKDAGFAASTSEARRLVGQGAVRVDGETVDEGFRFIRGNHRLLAVGKRRLGRVE